MKNNDEGFYVYVGTLPCECRPACCVDKPAQDKQGRPLSRCACGSDATDADGYCDACRTVFAPHKSKV